MVWPGIQRQPRKNRVAAIESPTGKRTECVNRTGWNLSAAAADYNNARHGDKRAFLHRLRLGVADS